jgi:hypothetical protein
MLDLERSLDLLSIVNSRSVIITTWNDTKNSHADGNLTVDCEEVNYVLESTGDSNLKSCGVFIPVDIKWELGFSECFILFDVVYTIFVVNVNTIRAGQL